MTIRSEADSFNVFLYLLSYTQHTTAKMLKTIFIFGAITSLLGAAQAGEIQDASLGARGVPAGLDLDVELKMEMEREFADILPRAASTNFQVRPFPLPPLIHTTKTNTRPTRHSQANSAVPSQTPSPHPATPTVLSASEPTPSPSSPTQFRDRVRIKTKLVPKLRMPRGVVAEGAGKRIMR